MKTSHTHAQHSLSDSRGDTTYWSSTMVVSIVTGPFLVGLIGIRAIADGLTQLGLASEELFRGERLPILHTIPDVFSSDSATNSD